MSKQTFIEEDEYQIYARQLNLSNIQLQGQERLKKAKVLCVGAGGLGSITLLYLTAAGVGSIGIIDNDIVDLSNLQRQIIYRSADIGKYKAESACKNLCALNKYIKITTHVVKLNIDNADSIIKQYDIIIDCTDNFYSREIVSHACKKLHKVHVYAAIASFTGQASVFNYMGGPSYHEVYAKNLQTHHQSCNTHGVLGILPGMMGILQATETIKIITGVGEVLNGYILKYNALEMSMQKIKLNLKFNQYEYQVNKYSLKSSIPIIKIENYIALNSLCCNNKTIYLIDLRHANEYKIAHLKNAVNIPLSYIRTDKVLKLLKIKSRKNNIIIYCNSNIKSHIASAILHNAKIMHQSLKIT